MLNKVILIGRLATDPELRYTPSGVAVTSFRIAVDRPVARNEAGEKETDFIDIVAWRHSAEFAANYLNKGRLVAIDPRWWRTICGPWTGRASRPRTPPTMMPRTRLKPRLGPRPSPALSRTRTSTIRSRTNHKPC